MNYNQRKIVKKFQIALRRTLKGKNIEKTHFIYKYINKEELVNKIESSFIEDMNWDNFGKIWEIAHIIPVNLFDHEKEEDLKLCWNVKNIIPLLKKDNKDFGSCLLFAKFWFDKLENKPYYQEHINFIDSKISIYSKYIK